MSQHAIEGLDDRCGSRCARRGAFEGAIERCECRDDRNNNNDGVIVIVDIVGRRDSTRGNNGLFDDGTGGEEHRDHMHHDGVFDYRTPDRIDRLARQGDGDDGGCLAFVGRTNDLR